MANKMTWRERWDMHNEIGREHGERAGDALKRYCETLDTKDWAEYLAESRIRNKHYGIATAMCTRKHGR